MTDSIGTPLMIGDFVVRPIYDTCRICMVVGGNEKNLHLLQFKFFGKYKKFPDYQYTCRGVKLISSTVPVYKCVAANVPDKIKEVFRHFQRTPHVMHPGISRGTLFRWVSGEYIFDA